MSKITVNDVEYVLSKGKSRIEKDERYIFLCICTGVSFVMLAVTFIVAIAADFKVEDIEIILPLCVVMSVVFLFLMLRMKSKNKAVREYIRDCVMDAVPVTAEVELRRGGGAYDEYMMVNFDFDGRKKYMNTPCKKTLAGTDVIMTCNRYVGKKVLCYYSPKYDEVLFTAESRISEDAILAGRASYGLGYCSDNGNNTAVTDEKEDGDDCSS